MLERHEVEAFLMLAEELHFGRTAERLHVSTARISQTIRKLERRVGVPLFSRTSRRVELTADGRQLDEGIRPAWAQLVAAVERAVDTGRGLDGMLRVSFTGAAAGQLLVGASGVFRERHPECDVEIREAQIGQVLPWLNDDVVDLALISFPVRVPGLAMGPVLVTELRMLAVPAGHPFARRSSVSVEDLAGATIIRLPDSLPESLHDDRTPRRTPGGRPIVAGPSAGTFQEVLTLVGAGRGVFPVGAQAQRYYARPDVAYVPFSDAPPLEWGLIWRVDRSTARVRAFSRAAHDLASSQR